MNFSNLKWVKNVKPQNNDQSWAYKYVDMSIPEAKIFCLNWRTRKDKANAEKPRKGELMLLLQNATVTHLVEFIDSDIYENASNEWGIYRVAKVLWMPPPGFNWSELPHQQEFFGFDYVVGDGAAHDLSADGKMPQFHRHWDKKGGLEAFQKHLSNLLTEISSLSISA